MAIKERVGSGQKTEVGGRKSEVRDQRTGWLIRKLEN